MSDAVFLLLFFLVITLIAVGIFNLIKLITTKKNRSIADRSSDIADPFDNTAAQSNTADAKRDSINSQNNTASNKNKRGGCFLFVLIIIGIVMIFVFIPRKPKNAVVFDFSNHLAYGKEIDPQGLKLLAGDLISIIQTEGSVIVKAKIESSLTKNMTINQNFYTAGDLIKNHGFNTCDEFKYWAVADMTNGQESKVIQYTLTKDVINGIYKGNILDNQIRDYATDVWILPSLLK